MREAWLHSAKVWIIRRRQDYKIPKIGLNRVDGHKISPQAGLWYVLISGALLDNHKSERLRRLKNEEQIRTHINFRRKQSVIMNNCLIFICLKNTPMHFIIQLHRKNSFFMMRYFSSFENCSLGFVSGIL